MKNFLTLSLTLVLVFFLTSCQTENKELVSFSNSSLSSAENDYYSDGEKFYCVSGSYKTSYRIENLIDSHTIMSDSDLPEDFRISSVRGLNEKEIVIAAVNAKGDTTFFSASCDDNDLCELYRVSFSVSEWTVCNNNLVLVNTASNDVKWIFVFDIETGKLSTVTTGAVVCSVENNEVIYAVRDEQVEVVSYDVTTKQSRVCNRAQFDTSIEIVGVCPSYIVLKEKNSDNSTCFYEYSFDKCEKTLISTEYGEVSSFINDNGSFCYLSEYNNEQTICVYTYGEKKLKPIIIDQCELLSFTIVGDNSLIAKGLSRTLINKVIYYSIDSDGNIAVIGQTD